MTVHTDRAMIASTNMEEVMALKLLALAGKKRAGKDTAAQPLIEAGFQQVAFADALREFAEALDPYIGPGVRLQEALQQHGSWEGIKSTEYAGEARRMLQRLGTDAGRNVLGQDIWVQALSQRIDFDAHDRWVITDCRFPNEAEWVHHMGGTVIAIVRPTLEDDGDTHPSEEMGFRVDGCVVNDSTIEELHRRMLQWTR